MALFWSTLEPCLCIINANLPMVRTFLAAVAPTVFGSTKDQTTRKSTLPGQSGPDPFEFRAAQCGYRTENIILGGREDDNESERYLTQGNNHIIVGRSVDIESSLVCRM
jgi:hypothetical protein